MRGFFLLLPALLFICVAGGDIRNGTKILLSVQAIWRHGDRAPTKTYKGDYYQEAAWTFGGSGWGQLSPVGMRQHLKLGKRIRNRYVSAGPYKGFLQSWYDSHEIYIRSTDVNRTIISAMSNMIGMYGQPDYGNSDYPQGIDPNATAGDPIWPAGYVPIAVHTVDDDTDYIGNADATCTRQDQLWAMAKTSPELVAFINSPKTSNLLSTLTKNCNQTVDIDNLWIVADAFLIEQLWMQDFQKRTPWWTPALGNTTVDVNDQVELYQNGVFNGTLMMNNLDIGKELQTIRGGSLTNDILMHANIKFNCWRNNDTSSKCTWINRNKYYAYSAHDTTLYAFFSCLGIQSKAVTPHGYPKYSAAVLFELWYDDAEAASYFRLMYHDKDGDDFYSITEDIPECKGNTYCPLQVYVTYAAKVKPPMPMDQWCQVDPNAQSSPSPTSTPSSIAELSSFTGILLVFAFGLLNF